MTIQLAASTCRGRSDGRTFFSAVDQATVTLLGNVASPGTVIINAPASGYGLSLIQYGSIVISGVTFTAGSGGNCIAVGQNCLISFGPGLVFGACPTGTHIYIRNGGAGFLAASYTISGSAGAHLSFDITGWAQLSGATVTLTGTPAFSVAFAVLTDQRAVTSWAASAFSGAATGVRYNINSGALINSSGGGASLLPGNAPGVGSGTNGALYM